MIEEVKIGMKVLDTKTKRETHVINKTISSVEVFQPKLSSEGINCSQWFLIDAFVKRFKY